MTKKKIFCVVLASVLVISAFVVPALALAETSRQDEVLQEYDIQGYDDEGNAILSNEDYEDYMNRMLEELANQKKK